MPGEIPSYSAQGLSIDAFKPEDLPVFRELLDEMVDSLDMRDVYTVTDDQLSRLFFGEHSAMEAIMARYQGEPAGIATWAEGFHLVSGRSVMSFEYIYVRPRFRSHMVPLAMMVYLAVLAKRRNHLRMEGYVHDWNSPVTELYRKLNVEEVSQTLFSLTLDKVDWTPYESLIAREGNEAV